MTDPTAVVFVVEDDTSMRNALKSLLRSVGLKVELFESGQEFLQHKLPDVPSCLVLDVRLPGLSGLDVQRELTKAKVRIPIIFITAHGDIPMSVRAMKAGAVEFLTKPFRDQDLLDAIQSSLERDRTRRQREGELMELEERFLSLTARERQLLPLIVSGRPNKEIASEIGTSEITVKVHRANVMKKMQAESFADLIRIAGKLNIPSA
jgi:FixJ family two-component response regulator